MAIKIALDCGHGLKTAGKQTPDGIKEWTLNDKVRDKVVSYLSAYDVEILNVDGNEGNTDESLSARLNAYLNAGAKVFVSIHHNAYTGKWNTATGVEVFTDKKPTEADKKLAECIYPKLVKYTGLKGRGIKKENWYVINQNRIPAVLVEGGFMDGKKDYQIITSEAGQDAYARAVAEGLVEFLNIPKKQTTTPTFNSYKVKVTATALNIRKGAGTNYGKAGVITDKGVYTIVAEANGKGATKWGKLKSGVGWISLDYCKKI